MRKRNWKKYNKSLIERGSLTFLIDPKALRKLMVTKKKGVGRPLSFSDNLILLLLTIKIHFSLPYRALEGFAKWAFAYAASEIDLPTVSVQSRKVIVK